MRVLIAGGQEWLHRSLVDALGAAGHRVRLVNSPNTAVMPEWPAHVEPWHREPTSTAEQSAALTDCDVAMLVVPAGDISSWTAALDHRPATRLIVVTIAGRSDAAQNHDAERIVGRYAGDWLFVRSALVYGIGDDPLSRFMALMRSVPVIPLLSSRHVVRPVWHRDFSQALTAALDPEHASWRQTVTLRGPDTTNPHDLYDRFSLLLDRHPWRIPMPDPLASGRLAEWHWPDLTGDVAGDAQSAEEARADDALAGVFGVMRTSLAAGLHLLINELPEQGPWEGSGRLELKHFRADIVGGRLDARQLMQEFRRSFKDVMPVATGVEPAAANVQLIEGKTVTMQLPGRGHVQVRVERTTDTETIVATLRGHVVAGVVRFCTIPAAPHVRFEITTCDTPSHWLDWIALRAGGARLQDANWLRLLTTVATLAGGETRHVHSDNRMLEGDEAARHDAWIADIIAGQRDAQPAASSELPLALVTGGSRNIGLELARCCAQAGYALLIVGHDARHLAAAQDALDNGLPIETVEADLSMLEGIDRVEEALAGRVPDILIANVGVALGGAFLDQPFDRVHHLIKLNITGTLDLIQRVARGMRARRSGRMLITSSISAAIPGPYNGAYNGSKSFLTSFAAAFRNEVAADGVVVTCLMPGPTDTAIFEKAGMKGPRVRQQRKDNPREVAEAGFAALMQGDGAVVPGWNANLQSTLAQVAPATLLAAAHKRSAEPRD